MAYPSSTDSFTGFTPSHTLSQDSHAAQHNQEQAAIVAIENKVGLGSSTPAQNTVLRGTTAGTTTYDQVHMATDVSGILGTANGGTGTSSTTGTGSAVFNSSPTIVNATLTTPALTNATGSLNQPTIGDFTNANHDHSTASKGGQLSSTAFPTGGLNATVLNNPYKFSVYRSAAWTSPNNSVAQVVFDTIEFDTGSNYSTSTGEFTAPVAGFYLFTMNVTLGAAVARMIPHFYKNGSDAKQGTDLYVPNADGVGFSAMIQLAVGDTVDARIYTSSNVSGSTSSISTYFQGLLLSAT